MTSLVKNKKRIFESRSLCVVNDLTIDEQLYLYKKVAELKQRMRNRDNVEKFKIDDKSMGVYILFLEDSTRTKESFINASHFHYCKMNVFDASRSSFSKKESYADTFNMLCGYSRYSLFITRTKLEGVCRWLEDAVGAFADRNGIQRPAFINGGDGKHEHPTQEILDEFTFLEHKNWDNSQINVALIGDLLHGRTVHSKADGLKIFKEVNVDLVAPSELAMPEYYVNKMKSNGFNVRRFESIEEYLSAKNVAGIWYFTRPQLERMGEDVLKKAGELRKAITFRKEFLDSNRLPDGAKFYHPLPRHKEHPTLPTFLDDTPLNGWEMQSMNGYYTRIMLLSMLGGAVGDDFDGKMKTYPEYKDDFIEEVEKFTQKDHNHKVGIKPIDNGIVIDHIEKGQDIKTVWEHIDKIRRILHLNKMSSHGVYRSESDNKYKGIISLPDFLDFDKKQTKMLAAISPDCTVNVVKGRKVVKKHRLHMPPRIYNFDEISCKNPSCISYVEHGEGAMPVFTRTRENLFECRYCEKTHNFKEVWDTV